MQLHFVAVFYNNRWHYYYENEHGEGWSHDIREAMPIKSLAKAEKIKQHFESKEDFINRVGDPEVMSIKY